MRFFACNVIRHISGSATLAKNQHNTGGQWVPLGTFDLIPGQNHRVALRNANLSQTAIADAIRYEWVGESRDVMADSARFVRNDAQAVHYLLWDHLFTPQNLVDGNRAVVSGAVVWDAAFTPYGAKESLLGSAVLKLRLPGQYADEETGRGNVYSLIHSLYYNFHRNYDAALGRYVEVDPLGLIDGSNPYHYAGGNPVNRIDPPGTWSTEAHNEIIDRAFPDLSKTNRNLIKQGSKYADKMKYQGAESSHMHAMGNGMDSNAELCRKIMDYIREHMGNYQRSMDELKRISGKNPWLEQHLRIQAYRELGMALHPVMDSTSPAHRGWQVWEYSVDTMAKHGDSPWSIEDLKSLQEGNYLAETLAAIHKAMDGDFSCECSGEM